MGRIVRSHVAGLLVLAWLTAGAPVAQATTPGLDLSWSACDTTAASMDLSYACTGTLGHPVALQGMFRPSVAIPDFAGISAVLDIGFAGAVPAYWQTAAGECNFGAFTAINPTATAPCVVSNLFDPTYSGGGLSVTYPAPNRLRIRVDWATLAPTPPAVQGDHLYAAFKVVFDADAGVNSSCAGCSTPACVVLNWIEVFGFSSGEDYLINAPDVRRHVTWQGGGIGGLGCPAETPTRNTTWGAIKSQYR